MHQNRFNYVRHQEVNLDAAEKSGLTSRLYFGRILEHQPPFMCCSELDTVRGQRNCRITARTF